MASENKEEKRVPERRVQERRKKIRLHGKGDRRKPERRRSYHGW